MRPPYIDPMLAGYGVPAGSITAWAAEPKLDGWRAAPRRYFSPEFKAQKLS